MVNDRDLRGALTEFVNREGTFHEIDDLDEVDQEEWDALITDQITFRAVHDDYGNQVDERNRIKDHLLVLRFFSEDDASSTVEVVRLNRRKIPTTDNPGFLLRGIAYVPGREIRATSSALDPRLSTLVRDSLLAAANLRAGQFGIAMQQLTGPTADVLHDGFRPLLIGPSSMFLGLNYAAPSGPDRWYLPSDVLNPRQWLEYIFERWSSTQPAAFPTSTSWREAETWRSKSERDAAQVLEASRAERAAVLVGLDQQILELEADLQQMRELTSAGTRRLLTAQGDELAEEVGRAFRSFGFDVLDSDVEVSMKGSRVEDFRITLPGDNDFIALVEVTGTKKGIGEEKHGRLSRHAKVFISKDPRHRIPREWFVGNQAIEQDPEVRPPLLSKPTIEAVEEDGNLVIDSPALYLLVQSLEHDVHPDSIRDFLLGQTGRVDLTKVRAWINEKSGK